MKKSFSKLLLAVSIAFLTGCGNDDPKAVAQKWQKAIASGDIKGANELSTKNTRELNVFIMSMLSDKDKKEVAEIKFDIVKIDGNKAVVTSSNKDDDKIELVKQDGKWLVDINKDVNADEDTDKNTDKNTNEDNDVAEYGNDSPKAVAQKWQKAILSGDLKSANEVSTKRTPNADMISMMSDKEAEDTKAFANAKNDIVKIKGNKAIVTSSNDKRGIDLVKQDGKWLVDINIDEE